MSESQISTAAHLRERAAYYRDLARRAESDGIAREFYAMAEEYEEDAGRITDQVDGAAAPRRRPGDRRWR
ncbi:MAG: hypothetical protein JO128_02250 [Alphaproteobacteria bacterium]|nr:hypothetical protein [Alphaproteobacteria bacterium]